MSGLDLLKILIESTGLPTQAVEREIAKMLVENSLDPTNLTLDDVRELLAGYLQDVLVEAKASPEMP